jgi:Ca-activated chloride channel homolog
VTGWFEAWTGLLLQEPWWCALWIALPVAAWRARRRAPAAATFAPAGLLADGAVLPPTWRTRLLLLPAALHALAVALAILALARPAHRVQQPVVRQGIDILLCLDASSSMATADLGGATSRFDAARAAAAAFVRGRPSDRIGLCAFARFADLVCPPTLDHGALERMLAGLPLAERDGQEDATGIGGAVARCVQVLSTSTAPGRVVIVVTDGEENVAAAGTPNEIGPLQAAQLAQQNGVRVHCLAVGVGTPDRSGSVIPLDTSQIEQLAQRSGGRFFRARDGAAMPAIYAEIDRLERAPFAEPRWRLEPRHAPLLLAALLLALAALALRRTWLEVAP